ncbi:hypothetical protein NDU88_000367 [Pleurodeles waltl]|uniref:Uncharacterized protein n=1 Tax=Pleurodeles waltl TaxID=8319 RepID=A0AAV7TG34_PLEWA|nr:hypothetical protein NDU88_000367 [Pleurodeles waltl]
MCIPELHRPGLLRLLNGPGHRREEPPRCLKDTERPRGQNPGIVEVPGSPTEQPPERWCGPGTRSRAAGAAAGTAAARDAEKEGKSPWAHSRLRHNLGPRRSRRLARKGTEPGEGATRGSRQHMARPSASGIVRPERACLDRGKAVTEAQSPWSALGACRAVGPRVLRERGGPATWRDISAHDAT